MKDKSAGYPHLVNSEPEPVKTKPEKEEKKHDVVKSSQASQNSQQTNYNPPKPKTEHHPTTQNWSNNNPNYNEGPRLNFQPNKSPYNVQNQGINFNTMYPPPLNTALSNQGIRLPVVNPKEIDVRSAALQKQNSRQDMYQDGAKFNNYQISGDKKNFLNDLPPRFANQYRYWQQSLQNENQFNTNQDNKFREDNFNNTNLQNNQYSTNVPSSSNRPNWQINSPINQEHYPPQTWWKPENPPANYNTNFSNASLNIQPNYYSSMPNNLSNPYQTIPSYNQGLGSQNKQESLNLAPNYLQPNLGQPQQMQNIQNMVPPSSFNSSLNSFGTYGQTVGRDSLMYPQFGGSKLNYPPDMKGMDKPLSQFSPGKNLLSGLNYGGNILGDMQLRNSLNVNYNDPLNPDMNSSNNQIMVSD